MTGDIIRAITLTTYGTAFIKDDYDISGLTLEHPSFKFTNKVEFLFLKKRFFGKPRWHQYADNPIDWLEKLKQDGCKELRLTFQPDNSISLSGSIVPDYKLAGFVGGGGTRFIQTVFDDYSDFWQSAAEVTDKDSPSQRIWTVRYGRTITGKPTQAKAEYDISGIKERLKAKLIGISSFAKENNESFWADLFDRAINLLDSPNPFGNKSDKIVPAERMNITTIQLLAGSGEAWCFGGMGSWNVISFKEKDKQEKYESLSAELYDLLNESYLAVANSYK